MPGAVGCPPSSPRTGASPRSSTASVPLRSRPSAVRARCRSEPARATEPHIVNSRTPPAERGGTPRNRRSQSFERPAAAGQFHAVAIEQSQPERLQRPGAAVGRRGAAQPDDELASAGGEGIANHLADAAARRPERIEVLQERQPRALGELDHGHPARKFEPAGRDRTSVGTVTRRPVEPSAGNGSGNRVERPLTAVGLRHQLDQIVRVFRAPALGEAPGRLGSGRRALERVGGDHHIQHGAHDTQSVERRAALDRLGSCPTAPRRCTTSPARRRSRSPPHRG